MTITIIGRDNKILYHDVIKKVYDSDNSFKKILEDKEKKVEGQDKSAAVSPIDNKKAANVKHVVSPDEGPLDNKNIEINQKPIVVPDELLPIFKEAAEKYDIDEGILIALAKQESNFHKNSVSSAGAVGIMQLMPKTAEALGVKNSYDPRENIMGGAKLLSGHLKKYDGNLSLALAVYGAGGGAVHKYGGIPPYKETKGHIPRVLSNFARGYRSESSKEVKRPEASYLFDQILKYKETKGSAFQEGVTVTERQKGDLINLINLALNYKK